jgi:uncharacterized membrane protein YedE/YeeE
MAKNIPPYRDVLFLKLFFKTSPKDVTNEEVAYFREHPDEIDEITAPIYIHKLFLWLGLLLGTVLVGISKALNYSVILAVLRQGAREFVVDIVFEVGVALIGAALTAYILGIVLNKQQENAAEWRAEIRRRIGGRNVQSRERPVIPTSLHELTAVSCKRAPANEAS